MVTPEEGEGSVLIDTAKRGSPAAIGQALDECRRYLLHIAEQELPNELKPKGGASDLVQETFLEAHRDFAQFQGSTPAELRAWLRQILRNRAAKFGRKYRNTDKRQMAREHSLNDGASGFQKAASIACDQQSPSEQIVGREQESAVRQAVLRLPVDYRQVVVLRYLEGRSFEEIGEAMGRTGNAVRLLWLRAIERMQRDMDFGSGA